MGLGETGLGETGLGETGLGEMGLGETGLGETGLGETGLGETGGHPLFLQRQFLHIPLHEHRINSVQCADTCGKVHHNGS